MTERARSMGMNVVAEETDMVSVPEEKLPTGIEERDTAIHRFPDYPQTSQMSSREPFEDILERDPSILEDSSFYINWT